jgi:hypothetical protein
MLGEIEWRAGRLFEISGSGLGLALGLLDARLDLAVSKGLFCGAAKQAPLIHKQNVAP